MQVQLPNGQIITSIGQGALRLAQNMTPIDAHIFDSDDLDRTLVAAADICDQGNQVLLSARGAKVIAPDGTVIMQTEKQPYQRLWIISPPGIQPAKDVPQANAVISHQVNAEFVE